LACLYGGVAQLVRAPES